MGTIVALIGGFIALVTGYISWRRHESATRTDVTSRGISANQLRLQHEIAAEQRLRAEVQNLTDARNIEREIYRLERELGAAAHSSEVLQNERALKRRGAGVLLGFALLGITLVGVGTALALNPDFLRSSSSAHPASSTASAGETPRDHTKGPGIDAESTAQATSPSTPLISESDAVDWVVRYFRVAGSRDYTSAWGLLSLRYQRAYGSYERFVDFWNRVRIVGMGGLQGEMVVDGANEVELTADVFYLLRSGTRSDERATFVILRDQSGGLLIDGYSSVKVLSGTHSR